MRAQRLTRFNLVFAFFLCFAPQFSLHTEVKRFLTEPCGTRTLTAAPSNTLAYHAGVGVRKKKKEKQKKAAGAAITAALAACG